MPSTRCRTASPNAGSKSLSAFAVSAGVAGLAGSLIAVQLGTMTQRNFESLSSLVVFSLGVFTGAQFVEGAIIAGVLTVALPEVLRQLGLPLDLAELLFGVGAVQALHRGVGASGPGFRLWVCA